MNKFDITKIISKTPAMGNPVQEIIKVAALVAAACLAYKIEDIVKAIIDGKDGGEIHYGEENNMCALFGWLDYKGIVPYKILKKLTQALANAAEERGTDASGISYVRDGKITIYKRPKPAHKLRFNVPDGTTTIMGHTRMATQGDKSQNFNNHPFSGAAGDISFAFAA